MIDDGADDASSEERGFIGAIKRHRKVLLFAALIWLVLLMGTGLTLSTMEVKRGLHVFGSEHWVAGQSRVLRIALKNLERGGTLPLNSVQAHFVDAQGESSPVQTLSNHVGPFVQGQLIAPRRAGVYSLILEAEDGNETLVAETTIELTTKMNIQAFPLAPPPRPANERDRGPTRFDIFPMDGLMPGALDSQLVFVSSQPSQDLALTIDRGRSRTPLPERIQTDARGLAVVPVQPAHPWFEFTIKTEDSQAERTVKQTPTQFTLSVERIITGPGPLAFEVRSLHRSGPIFVDLWVGEHWMRTMGIELENGIAKGHIDVPALPWAEGLLWLQAYRDPYMPGEARGARHLIFGTGENHSSHQTLMARMHTGGFTPQALMAPDGPAPTLTLETWSRILLGRLPRPAHDPPLLTDSSESARQTVAGIKSVWIGRMATGMAIGGALLFGVLVMLIRSNQDEIARNWREAGGDEDGDVGTRKRILIDAGYMFLVIAFFVIGMIQVMLSVRW